MDMKEQVDWLNNKKLHELFLSTRLILWIQTNKLYF